MPSKDFSFFRLILWEIEEYLNFPTLEFLIASAIIAILARTQVISTASFAFRFTELFRGSATVFLFLTLSVSAIFSRSFAGSFSRGELKLLLSFPVKRRSLFLSKLVTMLSVVFAVYGITFSLHLYLYVLNPLDPMFYVSLLALFLQLFLACSITVAISLITKSEVMSILASVLFLLGIDSLIGSENILSAQGRFKVLFGYFGELTRGWSPFNSDFTVTTGDVIIGSSFPIVISLCLLVLSFLYFTRFMEVD